MGNLIHAMIPPFLMVFSQIIFTGVNVMYKVAANDGMNLRIIIVYRFLFATAFMLPIALILERKSLKKINGRVLFLSFLCGLFGGSLSQNLYLQSLVYTSATYVSAMLNLIPAVTFILTIIFKLEKLSLGKISGKLKALGTLICVGGAMVFTFYDGPEISIWSTNLNILSQHDQGNHVSLQDPGKFILGAFLGFLSCVSYSVWLIIQAKMNATFPFITSSTALMCLMGAIQGAALALCTDRDWSQWKLGWNIRLLATAFLGIMGSGLIVFLLAWAVRTKGPLYTSIFAPLGLIFTAIVGSLILDEKLHLGSIMGGILIVCGVYMVLRGKSREMKQKAQLVPIIANEFEMKEGDNKESVKEDESVYMTASAGSSHLSTAGSFHLAVEGPCIAAIG